MEKEFIKAVSKFVVAVAVIAAVVLMAVGAAILLLPKTGLAVLAYVLGGLCLTSGISLAGSLFAGLLR